MMTRRLVVPIVYEALPGAMSSPPEDVETPEDVMATGIEVWLEPFSPMVSRKC
jgi:hypothetical protein